MTLFITSICAAETDVISYLVPLIIQAESSGNSNASDGQSFGLMGIGECVLKDFNAAKVPNEGFCTRKMILRGERIHEENLCYIHYFLKDLYIPEKNMEVGTWYLRKIQSWLPAEYKESKAHIIYCYNSGIGKLCKNNWKIPTWTKNHPNKIYRKIYRGVL